MIASDVGMATMNGNAAGTNDFSVNRLKSTTHQQEPNGMFTPDLSST